MDDNSPNRQLTDNFRSGNNPSWQTAAALAARNLIEPSFDQDSYSLSDYVGLSYRLQAEEARG